MNRIPGGLRTDQQPPMAIPFRHFVLSLAFLVGGVVGGTVMAVRTLPGLAEVAHVHVLLLGWVGVTIMGAMTQFVPVWSGVSIHSRRLAVAQLWLVVGGLAAFVPVLLAGELAWLAVAAVPLLVGVWLFVYNVGRTLWRARPLEFTERHFAVALASFALLAPLGYLLAVDFTTPLLEGTFLDRGDVLLLHATLALYGAVVATIIGALVQLAKMFAQFDLEALDDRLLALEQPLFVVGLAAFAAGRGLGLEPLARIGAVFLLVGLIAVAVVVTRILAGSTAERSPMTDRYWIVVASLYAWVFLTLPAWWVDPLGPAGLFGHPDATNLLVFGVFAFVVVGSLYHIVPFILWLEQYSDRLGFEQVPMIDDLYDDRLERADFALTVVGFAGMAVAPLFDLPAAVSAASGLLATVGFCLFVVNVLLTIHRHGPGGIVGAFLTLEDGDGSDEPADVADVDVDGT
ncbi:heme-copper oxidase family protein [Halobiforma nitratireducens]|uniref:Cytochrome oxidase subunit I profile domain-containing protein n=1 Tax=Halobiforma nitratireducens JCM 10879 TaxID=1227454 RepID=M0M552_9EURY|nr:hypothetical protein [Halobiforma nitratireducens]EMA39490.1 hypothetical protein C446_08586 [Halobiforma nitratireducens JCM 10879]